MIAVRMLASYSKLRNLLQKRYFASCSFWQSYFKKLFFLFIIWWIWFKYFIQILRNAISKAFGCRWINVLVKSILWDGKKIDFVWNLMNKSKQTDFVSPKHFCNFHGYVWITKWLSIIKVRFNQDIVKISPQQC